MKAKDLKEDFSKIPDDADVVIGKPFVLIEEDQITGIVDIPIIGTAYSAEDKEFRFVLSADDVKKVFIPGEVKFFKDEPTP